MLDEDFTNTLVTEPLSNMTAEKIMSEVSALRL